MKALKKILKVFLVLLSLLFITYFLFFKAAYPPHVLLHSWRIGDSLDAYNGVAVYNNGANYPQSHGRHYTADRSYYFGKKWQCVEFVKRYYYIALSHRMPDGFGHAKDFFDAETEHGGFNARRGLLQYSNGKNEKPMPNDLLVFNGSFGHVAIVTRVTGNEVEVIQQNIFMRPRETFRLVRSNGNWTVGEDKKPLGWLRKK